MSIEQVINDLIDDHNRREALLRYEEYLRQQEQFKEYVRNLELYSQIMTEKLRARRKKRFAVIMREPRKTAEYKIRIINMKLSKNSNLTDGESDDWDSDY